MSQIKERPILFSAPMVRAILEGRKTVTRREVKKQAALDCLAAGFESAFLTLPGNADLCPYGQPGERLWVRETFMDLLGTGVEHRPTPESPIQRYSYGADVRPGSFADDTRKDMGLKWKPSIHMPRAASRILLEIAAVRVERLQAISRADIRAEGLECPPELASDDVSPNYRDRYPKAWRELWESINGAESWNSNPWVWVVEFKRVRP